MDKLPQGDELLERCYNLIMDEVEQHGGTPAMFELIGDVEDYIEAKEDECNGQMDFLSDNSVQ